MKKDFTRLIKENKSFCSLPFLQHLLVRGKNAMCCLSEGTKEYDNTKSVTENISEDITRQEIHKKMISGEKVDHYCKICQEKENKGQASMRETQSIYWLKKAKIESLEELINLSAPLYYEIRPTNKCNLMCRICSPEWSSLIEKEAKHSGFFKELNYERDSFAMVELSTAKGVYVAGGEPSISKEFHAFLQKVINENRTDLEITVNTNGMSFSKEFKEIIEQLNNIHFVISVDGYNKVNEYARWPSKWNKIQKVLKYLNDRNIKFSFSTVFSIYNIADLSRLFKFFDSYNPISVTLNAALDQFDIRDEFLGVLSYQNFPDSELVIRDLEKALETKTVKNHISVRNTIKALIKEFKSKNRNISLVKLKKFFEYNDRLDKLRNSRLADYIPELEQCRKSITKQI